MQRYMMGSMAYGFSRTMYLSDSELVTERLVHSTLAAALSPWTFPFIFLNDVTNVERYVRGLPIKEPTVFPKISL